MSLASTGVAVTQTKYVLIHPPLETADPSKPNAVQLTVTKSLAIGNTRGAQLVVCSIVPKTSTATPFMAVAKVLDPIYYSFSDEIVSAPADVVRLADRDQAARLLHTRRQATGNTQPGLQAAAEPHGTLLDRVAARVRRLDPHWSGIAMQSFVRSGCFVILGGADYPFLRLLGANLSLHLYS